MYSQKAGLEMRRTNITPTSLTSDYACYGAISIPIPVEQRLQTAHVEESLYDKERVVSRRNKNPIKRSSSFNHMDHKLDVQPGLPPHPL